MSETPSFSIVLTTYKAHEELSVTLASLQRNSRMDNELLVIINPLPDGSYSEGVLATLKKFGAKGVKNPVDVGPYGSWNRGAELARHDFVCFINDDQYFAPDWDINIARHATSSNVLSSQLVEPGFVRPYHTILCQNFGFFAEEFDEKGFLEFVKKTEEDRLAWDGYYIPTVMHKHLFNELGRWPEIKPFPYPNDKFFRKAMWKRGLEYQRVMNSFSYHFQNSSQKNKEEKRSAHRLYHDRPPEVAPRAPTLAQKTKQAMKECLQRVGYKPRVSGYAFPPKTDRRLAYRYCLGKGLEIGCMTQRFPHINAENFDICRRPHAVVGPRSDHQGTLSDLSRFAGDSFDFVLSYHALTRIDQSDSVLASLSRLVKNGGHLIFIVPANGHPISPEAFARHLGNADLEVAEFVRPDQKQEGIDEMPFDYDDFTVVCRVKKPVGANS